MHVHPSGQTSIRWSYVTILLVIENCLFFAGSILVFGDDLWKVHSWVLWSQTSKLKYIVGFTRSSSLLGINGPCCLEFFLTVDYTCSKLQEQECNITDPVAMLFAHILMVVICVYLCTRKLLSLMEPYLEACWRKLYLT